MLLSLRLSVARVSLPGNCLTRRVPASRGEGNFRPAWRRTLSRISFAPPLGPPRIFRDGAGMDFGLLGHGRGRPARRELILSRHHGRRQRAFERPGERGNAGSEATAALASR